jgi:multisubunit Na+/H+ antiporter MnhF subunit
MDTLAITSVTNFLLASELFFLAGLMVRTSMARFSAAWFWAGAILALATSALIGGIDHGFVEPAGLSRYWIQRPNWIVLGLVTLCMLLATSRQYLAPSWHRPILALGTIQLIVFTTLVLQVEDYGIVVANYLPVTLILLILSMRGTRYGGGSWQMVAGILLLLAASIVQVLRVNAFSPVSADGLYHLISMAGVVFMYWGGQRLKVT